jgi:hypothetical protein
MLALSSLALIASPAWADSFQLTQNGRTYTCTSDEEPTCTWSVVSTSSVVIGCVSESESGGCPGDARYLPTLQEQLTEVNSCTGATQTVAGSVTRGACTPNEGCNQ